MAEKIEKPYGCWPSPITPELITQDAAYFQDLQLDGQTLYYSEMRPSEKGRTVIIKEGRTLTPEGFNVRTRVHEYGGASFAVKEGILYFINFSDQRLYRQRPGEAPEPLTAEGAPRLADMRPTGEGIAAVAEKHSGDGEPENYLALVDPERQEVRPLASGADFYAAPALNSDESRIAWIEWNHPNMPWDGTELWTAEFSAGGLRNKRKVAGGENISVIQPRFGPDGKLYYLSDESGWWNLYREGEGNLFPMEAELGSPPWIFGLSNWDFIGDKILAAYREKGKSKLALLDPESGKIAPIETSGSSFGMIRGGKESAAFIMVLPTGPKKIMRFRNGPEEVVEESLPKVDPALVSAAEHIAFPSSGGRTAYGYYYAPKNPEYRGPEGKKPPLIVKSHGGPTSSASDGYNLRIQYWTSRGFAILDVDYGGSTGYGRAYRELLKESWGVVDLQDVESGAEYLVEKGLADPERLAITGGSAGGYTTLSALTFGDTFTVGASYYGVSDLELLAKETHKFESRYLDRLIGPYPGRKDLYIARSPTNFSEQLNCPVIFFQGTEDKIVPPNQAETLYQALKKKGVLTELVLYEGEQHGFRKAATIRDALRKELEFYLKAWEQCKELKTDLRS